MHTALVCPCYKETQLWAGRHKQELDQETIKGTRTGELRQPAKAGQHTAPVCPGSGFQCPMPLPMCSAAPGRALVYALRYQRLTAHRLRPKIAQVSYTGQMVLLRTLPSPGQQRKL